MPDDLRMRFPVGCHVRFSALALRTFALPPDIRARVVGYEHTGKDLRIVRDGTHHREIWHVQYLERVEEHPHA